MGQLGHTDARLTLNVYAQVVQRQQVDDTLIWRLMRFPGERQPTSAQRANETTSETLPLFSASA